MAFAVVFPGQGSQYVGMGKEFYRQFPEAKEVFERASGRLGIDVANLCFSSDEETLKLTENTQPTILTVSYAIYRVLEERLSGAAFFAGHSLGEYTACVAAGILSFEDAVYAVRNRGRFMQEAVPVGAGAMAAVIGLDAGRVEEVCREVAGVVEPANYNSPEQTVIAGEKEAVEKAAKLLKDEGAKRVVMLKVSAPFHCRLMRPAAERLGEVLKEMNFSDAKVPVVSNVTASPVTSGEEEKRLLIEQVVSPVKWYQSVLFMRERGVELFVEVGPSRVLSGLIKKTDRRAKVVNVERPEDISKLEARL